MYYFRDSYFDQQIAYGIASRSYGRPRKQTAAPVRRWHYVSEVVLSLSCLSLTFAVAYLMLDVLGLEHLVQIAEMREALGTLDVPRFDVSGLLGSL